MRSLGALGAILVACSAIAQPAAPKDNLTRARELMDQLKFADAAKPLEAAWNTPGNARVTVLEILKLQAIAAAAQGQTERATALFRTLLYLAPDYQLEDADLGPKVTSLFDEAKGRLTTDSILLFDPLAAPEGQAQPVGVAVKADPLKMVKKVRIHTRPIGAPEVPPQVLPLEGGVARVDVTGSVQWWAVLLGDQDRQLELVGSAEKPLVSLVATLRNLTPPPTPAAEAVSIPSRHPYRPIGLGLAGAGVVAGIVGAVLGNMSASAGSQLDRATRDTSGLITSLSRVQGLALDSKMRTNAIAANALFVASVALVGTGIVLFVLPGDVAVTASPGGGFGIQGSLP